jgi:protein tyrosine/serine phosphatase
MVDLPIKYSFWVVENKLIAGEYPIDIDEAKALKKIKSILKSGIKVFIDLTEKDELRPYYNLIKNDAEYYRFPIQDLSVPDDDSTMVKILDTIDKSLANNKPVYVHCWGGVGRTGVVVGCWLSRHGLSGSKALNKLKELSKQNPKSNYRDFPDTKHQKNYILNWKEN